MKILTADSPEIDTIDGMIGRWLWATIVTKTAQVKQKAGAPIGQELPAPLVIGHGRGEPCDSLL